MWEILAYWFFFWIGKTCPVNVGHNKKKRQHLVTVTKEGTPGESPKWVDHYECGESGLNTAVGLYDYILASESTQTLRALGTDQTASMSSPKIGANMQIEKMLERPVQRLFCMLHMTELPARHLFEVSNEIQFWTFLTWSTLHSWS